MAFRIFEATSDQKNKVLDLFGPVWQTTMDPAELQWKYFDNPAGEARVWLARDDDKDLICGSWTLFPYRVNARGESLLCMQAGDLMVLPEYRRQGLFRAMYQASLDDLRGSDVRALIAFPQERGTSVKGFVDFGWDSVAALTTYKRPIQFGQVLKRFYPWVPGIVARSLTLAHNLRHRIKGQGKSDAAIEPVTEFDARYDRLFQGQATPSTRSIERSAAYLNWKFLRKPGHANRAFGIVAAGKVLGYIILRWEEKSLKILDLHPHGDPNVIAQLLGFVVDSSLREGAEMLACTCAGPLESVIAQHGFRRRELELRLMIHRIDDAPNQALSSECGDPWMLTFGDLDVA